MQEYSNPDIRAKIEVIDTPSMQVNDFLGGSFSRCLNLDNIDTILDAMFVHINNGRVLKVFLKDEAALCIIDTYQIFDTILHVPGIHIEHTIGRIRINQDFG